MLCMFYDKFLQKSPRPSGEQTGERQEVLLVLPGNPHPLTTPWTAHSQMTTPAERQEISHYLTLPLASASVCNFSHTENITGIRNALEYLSS